MNFNVYNMKKNTIKGKRSDAVINSLRQDIINGNYSPNSKLPPERDLAHKYSVSRVTIREAVNRLSQFGLVKTLPQSGTYVTDFLTDASFQLLIEIMNNSEIVDTDVLISLMEFRRLCEVFTIRNLVKNISSEGIEQLRSIMKAKNQAKSDLKKMSELHYEMHYTFSQLNKNIMIRLLFNSFKPIYQHYINLFFTHPGVVDFVIEKYEILISAIEARDESYAAYLMDEILIYGENRIKETLGVYNNQKQIRIR